MTCGERIRQEREKRRMSQEDLAERLEVSRQAVSKWESDASRPTKEKRERLSELFEIPVEAWDAPPAGERHSLRRWKTATAALAVALCLTLILGAVLWPRNGNAERFPSEDAQGPVAETLTPPSGAMPETLVLERWRDYDFGNRILGGYDTEYVPQLKDPEWFQNHRRWVGDFEHAGGTTTLELFWADPTESGGTCYFVYLLYTIPDADGICDWKISYRLAEGLTEEALAAGLTVEPFSRVAGYDGYRIDLDMGSRGMGISSYFFVPGPDGVPRLMTSTVGQGVVTFDVDEDGQLEIISPESYSKVIQILDGAEDGEGGLVYAFDPNARGNINLRFAPEMGGFVATDSQNTVLARYLLRDGALVRVPVTDFSAQDYPDVLGTEITFVTDFPVLSDGKGPDDVLYSSGGVRITHRQQAYLALQELYGLTGLTVDRCYCAANEDTVLFSLLPDGFNQRCFFHMDFREEYGGSGMIPSIFIFWRELGYDWSPLSFAEAERPGPEIWPDIWTPENEALRWYYDRLNVFAAGEAAHASLGELHLTNGDLYIADLQDTAYGPALFGLTGPYPGGEVRH